MKSILTAPRLIAVLALLLTLPPPAFGLTVESTVTPEFVKQNPKVFDVKVSKTKNGLLEFTITQNASAPSYIVASLSLSKDSSVVAETFFPPFVKQNDITFSFRIAPEMVDGAVFSLADCAFAETGGRITPMPGSDIHNFNLKDFVPKELLSPAPAKPAVPAIP